MFLGGDGSNRLLLLRRGARKEVRSFFSADLDTMESAVSTMPNKRCDSKKNGFTGLLTTRFQKALHLSSPVALPQHCTGSCPNLMMNRNEAAASRSQPALKTHQSLCFSLSSDGARQYKGLASRENLLAQVKLGHSGKAASSTGSLERASLFCASVANSPCKPTTSLPVESLSKPKSSSWFSLFTPWLRSNNSALDSGPLSVSGSKKCHNGCSRPKAATEPKPGELLGFGFLEPVITRVMDCVYVGNLRAAYSGQVLCKNNIDSIIDMSNMPSDCSLNFIPCTCSQESQHSWSRLKVHIQGALEQECTSLQQPCFWDINECIDASIEKRKRVLIHCRDGYSLAPTCVIQYLMVKHKMRLLAAYEFVKARYPLNIREWHQDLLVGLERSLWPEEVDMECFKQAMSRKMAWT